MTAPRTATVTRTTKETDLRVELTLDGSGRSASDTGIPFFDHMLQQLGKHAGWDLDVTCKGDLQVDGHHTVEDCGIAIGQALTEALGDKAGIRRFASIVVPLDEAAVEVALDLAGRTFVVHEVPVPVRDDRRVRHGPARGLRARVRAGGEPHGPRAPAVRALAPPHLRGGVQGAGEGARATPAPRRVAATFPRRRERL